MLVMTAPAAKPTPTIEDYLTVLYLLDRDGDEAIAARIAEALEVAPPTVTATLRRMERDGWLLPPAGRGLRLSPAGREAAMNVLRRHMLTEWLLTRVLQMPWSSSHADAHNMEHTISPEIETRLLENLQAPRTCPHGNPLPGFEEDAASWRPLISLAQGQRACLRRIHELAEDNQELIRYLEEHDLLPGTEVVVHEVLDFNQTITLKVKGKLVTLGYASARQLFFEVI